MKQSAYELSVVIPFYNEAGNVEELFADLDSALKGHVYEVVAVDDGSTDGTFEALADAAKNKSYVRILRFAMNAGQTAALGAGIRAATGDIVVTLDGDRENDPKDILNLISHLNEGHDIVCGWRKTRWQNAAFTRRLPSNIANWLIRKVTRVSLHDFGCTLRVYKRSLIQELTLYGDMHRFIPAYVASLGGKVGELPVSFRPRTYGKSKYGIGRTFKVLLDLLLFVFLTRFLSKPMQFFGGLGLLAVLGSGVALLLALAFRFVGVASLIETPLPLLASLFLMIGVQLILFGILAELMIRTYYESAEKRPYRIEERINF